MHGKKEAVKLSSTCLSCREQHLKCSGAPLCQRCRGNCTPCEFKLSRRGKRKPTAHQQSQSSARPGPVSLTTCVNCRERHLKCSGGPSCRRCAKEGRECLFKPSRRGHRKARPKRTTNPTASPLTVSLSRSPSIGPSLDSSSRSYIYFCDRTSRELCGHHDQHFWTVLCLQIGHNELAIRHTLAALGSLHESLEIGYSTWSDERAQPLHLLSLQQYNAAIKLLKQESHKLTDEVILISCILLVCFETLQNDYKSAVSLLRTGLKVLKRWQDSGGANEELVQAFSRLKLQASTFLQSAAHKLTPRNFRLSAKGRTVIPQIQIPSTFTNLRQANKCLDTMIATGYSIMDPITCIPDYPLTSKLLGRLQASCTEKYRAALNDLLCRRQHNASRFRKVALYLRIQYFISLIMTPSLILDGEMRFDNYTKEFGCIISLATAFLGIDDEEDSPGFRMGIIPSLFLCAVRCRDPVLRRKAVKLLSNRQWQERSWNSLTAGRVADEIIAVEEQGLVDIQSYTNVPSSSRIMLLKVEGMDAIASTENPGDLLERDIDGMWALPRLEDASAASANEQRLILRYVRSPWDLTSPTCETRLKVH